MGQGREQRQLGQGQGIPNIQGVIASVKPGCSLFGPQPAGMSQDQPLLHPWLLPGSHAALPGVGRSVPTKSPSFPLVKGPGPPLVPESAIPGACLHDRYTPGGGWVAETGASLCTGAAPPGHRHGQGPI